MKNAVVAAGFSLCFALAAAPHPEMLVSTDWLSQHLSDPNLDCEACMPLLQ